jgi:putative transposase
LDERMTRQLVINSFLKAYCNRKLGKGFNPSFRKTIASAPEPIYSLILVLFPRMSGKGNCYDYNNAVAESFFHTIKNELPNNCVFKTRNEAKSMIFEYIETFYNTKRRHSFLGYCSPNEFELLCIIKVA